MSGKGRQNTKRTYRKPKEERRITKTIRTSNRTHERTRERIEKLRGMVSYKRKLF